jgi:hypothetical protein
MAGSSHLRPGRRGYLGTDLSGSHPISFDLRQEEEASRDDDRDIGLQAVEVVLLDRDVKLDEQGKMQCTTCHDPHDDSNYQPGLVPRFWVKPTVGEVCLTCHVLR